LAIISITGTVVGHHHRKGALTRTARNPRGRRSLLPQASRVHPIAVDRRSPNRAAAMTEPIRIVALLLLANIELTLITIGLVLAKNSDAPDPRSTSLRATVP
jgi:hypothetical protein